MQCSCFCHDVRYNVIKELLEKYTRPVTVLELQSCCGFYTDAIARDFPDSVAVLLERTNSSLLLDVFLERQMSNIVLLCAGVNGRIVEHLASCEHFDLVIANTRLWKSSVTESMINNCQLLGDYLFLEVFTPSISRTLYLQLKKRGKEIRSNGLQKNEKLFLIRGRRSELTRPSWLKKPKSSMHFGIRSSFKEKKFIKSKEIDGERVRVESIWQSGINLITFKMLQGIYPKKEELKVTVMATRALPHDDWNPHNIIVQGNQVVLIDNNDPFVGWRWSWPEGTVAQFMDLENPTAIKKMMNRLFKHRPKRLIT